MHARSGVCERRVEHIFQTAQYIISVEHGILGHLAQPICTVAHDIGERTREHAHLAVKGAHATEALGMFLRRFGFLDQADMPVGHSRGVGQWPERRERFGQDHRSRPRPAPAVRGAKRLVEIDVHRINAKVSGADAAHNRVKVCAVAVNEAARRVDQIRNPLHVPFE